MLFMFLTVITFISSNYAQTPTLPALTDLTACNSFIKGFVSEYDENGIYFDVGIISNDSTVVFNACIDNNDIFNIFSFSLYLYKADTFFNSSWIEYNNAYDSRVRCGDHKHAGTYLEYTNVNNYTGYYILQIQTDYEQGGSYKITKECDPNTITLYPTPAPSPTNILITDTFNCGDIMSGTIKRYEWKTYKVEGIDFNASCGLTYAFDACPKQIPYVNNVNLNINLYDIINNSQGISATGISVYGDIKSGNGVEYCDTENDYGHGLYIQFTDTQCNRNEPDIVYLSLGVMIIGDNFWDGASFDYEIKFLCDTQFKETPAPTLPNNVEEIICNDNKIGIYNNKEIFYSINTDMINEYVAFNGCKSNFNILLTVYEVRNDSDSMWSHGNSNKYICDENEIGNYDLYTWGINSYSNYYLGIYNYDKCSNNNCQYDITMECSNFQTSTKVPTTDKPTKGPTTHITPSPTLLSDDIITCASRDIMGDLTSTISLRNTYEFSNTEQQFVLFSFCSMANFESKIFLYKENNDGITYDIIASSQIPDPHEDNYLNQACLNITGYFDSGNYWLAIEVKRNWNNIIIGLPQIGNVKYLLNVYCSTEAITKSKSQITPTPDHTTIGCNFVQISKHSIPMPIGVCNTKWFDYTPFPFIDLNSFKDRYSYKTECKTDKYGLQVTICPMVENCEGNSCFIVDASLESQCLENNVCDFTVFDYNCESLINCEYTTMRISQMNDDNIDTNSCVRNDKFYEIISMIIDDCYIKKTYGWISSRIGCNGLNSITINDYLIPFSNSNSNTCNIEYNYNTTIFKNGQCIYANSYIDIIYCPYTAYPTQTIYTSQVDVQDTSINEPTPSPTDIVEAVSTYSIIINILIGFIVVVSLGY
eukprot:505314_1